MLVQSILDNPMLNGTVIRLDGALRMQPWEKYDTRMLIVAAHFLWQWRKIAEFLYSEIIVLLIGNWLQWRCSKIPRLIYFRLFSNVNMMAEVRLMWHSLFVGPALRLILISWVGINSGLISMGYLFIVKVFILERKLARYIYIYCLINIPQNKTVSFSHVLHVSLHLMALLNF